MRNTLACATMLKHKVFLDIFAGTSPISAELAQRGYAVLPFDVLRGAAFDVSRPAVARTVLGWIAAGMVWGVWLATPCSTLSRARRARHVAGRMPAALRAEHALLGLPGLTPAEADQLHRANRCIKLSERALKACVHFGIPTGEENQRLLSFGASKAELP